MVKVKHIYLVQELTKVVYYFYLPSNRYFIAYMYNKLKVKLNNNEIIIFITIGKIKNML